MGKQWKLKEIIFLGSKITAYVDCSHEIKRHLLFRRKVMTNLLLLLLSHFSSVQLCATPQTGSPPGSPVPGILQARTLEWVAISFIHIFIYAYTYTHTILSFTIYTYTYYLYDIIYVLNKIYIHGEKERIAFILTKIEKQ